MSKAGRFSSLNRLQTSVRYAIMTVIERRTSVRNRTYLCIDLKSFYASVECVERGLDPLTTNLVVADPERCETTICLAVSPAMKALGVRNRCRVFEIPRSIDYITAPPRMRKYIACSARIYGIYLQFIAKEDIHVYSIDEAFLDVTCYLSLYGMTARALADAIRRRIVEETGIPAACGIGDNLYLAKVALDITAKHSADFIGELTEESYCRTLWAHQPLTDFWRVGPGTVRRLARCGVYTMGQVAQTPMATLRGLLGVDADILMDHAWGREPVTIADIKAYKARHRSISSGQVLPRGYSREEGLLIVKEMADQLGLALSAQHLTASSVSLYVGYEKSVLPPVHGSLRLPQPTASATLLMNAAASLYRRLVEPGAQVRRMDIGLGDIAADGAVQLSMFGDSQADLRDRRMQAAVNGLKQKYGRDVLLKGMDFDQAATARQRNHQIGGHKSGE